jgi:rubrerythrin
VSETTLETEYEPETTEEMAAEAPESDPEGDEDEPEAPDEDEHGDEQERLESLRESADFEKMIEKRYKQLDAEKQRHAKRLGEIMGDDAADLIQCPVCMDGIDGYIFPPDAVPLPDEAIGRIRQVIGLPDLATFAWAKDTEQCPECKGKGKTRTGSDVPGYDVKECGTCASRGWVNLPGAAPADWANGTTPPVATGPLNAGPELGDPMVDALRARGFAVIPPMAPVPGS